MITHAHLLATISYNPETGVMSWRRRPEAAFAHFNNGYLRVRIDGKLYYVHRLAWFYVHKKWPKFRLDHKNRLSHDNRFENLRECNASQNGGNSKYSTVALPKGVTTWRCRTNGRIKFIAQITLNRKNNYLGLFETPEEAHEAYRQKAQEFWGEFARYE